MVEQVADDNSGALRWKPLAKGQVQTCVCDLEGCCTTLTVLNTESNVLEIYQANVNSFHSCIARIVLPDNIALCKIDTMPAS
jgi:hypothetical protein